MTEGWAGFVGKSTRRQHLSGALRAGHWSGAEMENGRVQLQVGSVNGRSAGPHGDSSGQGQIARGDVRARGR